MCPHCGRDAPIVYRGALPYCTACGGLRAPLSSPSLNLAGKTSQVGGAVAKAIGWLVLLVGLSIALGLGLIVHVLAGAAIALGVALPVALIALVTGVALVTSGRSLSRSGTDAERSTRERALLELAAHRGAVTAGEAARALGLPVAEADAVLTALAKREPERMNVEVDDQGVVWYRPVRLPDDGGARVRVGPEEVEGRDEPETAEEQPQDESARRAQLRR